jgi:nucleotide-binding universal stress UspA family protein
MFRNILVPTDGSALSRKAIKRAVQLAKEQKGRVTGFYVGPAWQPRLRDDSISYRVVSPDEHAASVKKTATRVLNVVRTRRRRLACPAPPPMARTISLYEDRRGGDRATAAT